MFYKTRTSTIQPKALTYTGSFHCKTHSTLLVFVFILFCIGTAMALCLPLVVPLSHLKQLLFLLFYFAALATGYFSTFPQLIKGSLSIFCCIFIPLSISLPFFPERLIPTPLIHSAALASPLLFTLVLCYLQNLRGLGLIIPPAILGLCTAIFLLHRQLADCLVTLFSCTLIFLAALWQDWFGLKSKKLCALVSAAILAGTGFMLWLFGNTILQHFFFALHPESDPLYFGYIGTTIRLLLSSSKPFGTGSAVLQNLPPIITDSISAAALHVWGWVPVLIFYFGLFTFLFWCLAKALYLKNRFCQLAVFSILLTMGTQTLFSALFTCGYTFWNSSCPFLTRGPILATNMFLTGTLLSLFRQDIDAEDALLLVPAEKWFAYFSCLKD